MDTPLLNRHFEAFDALSHLILTRTNAISKNLPLSGTK